jgi:hypothetical protein
MLQAVLALVWTKKEIARKRQRAREAGIVLIVGIAGIVGEEVALSARIAKMAV